jgi:hypothetical protein
MEDYMTIKNILKKLLLLILFISSISSLMSVSAKEITPTGHEGFEKIIVNDGSTIYLINQLTQSEIKTKQKGVKWAAFGWRSTAFIKYYDVKYIGKTIFSRANSTSQSVDFTYSVTEESTITTSISLSGSISPKVSGKIQSVSASLDATIRGEIGKKNEISKEDKSSFKVTINPGKKVSLISKGDARLSSGAAKYYFFGICFKQGLWEYLDVVNEYYELCEENL